MAKWSKALYQKHFTFEALVRTPTSNFYLIENKQSQLPIRISNYEITYTFFEQRYIYQIAERYNFHFQLIFSGYRAMIIVIACPSFSLYILVVCFVRSILWWFKKFMICSLDWLREYSCCKMVCNNIVHRYLGFKSWYPAIETPHMRIACHRHLMVYVKVAGRRYTTKTPPRPTSPWSIP